MVSATVNGRTLECSGVSTSPGVVSRTLTLQVEDLLGHIREIFCFSSTKQLKFNASAFTSAGMLAVVAFVECVTVSCKAREDNLSLEKVSVHVLQYNLYYCEYLRVILYEGAGGGCMHVT